MSDDVEALSGGPMLSCDTCGHNPVCRVIAGIRTLFEGQFKDPPFDPGNIAIICKHYTTPHDGVVRIEMGPEPTEVLTD